MPWKWIVWGCDEPLPNAIRSRSPSRQRSVGPGMRPLYVHAAKRMPGATSISLSTAVSSHSRITVPDAVRRVVPQSKSRRIVCGSKPLAA